MIARVRAVARWQFKLLLANSKGRLTRTLSPKAKTKLVRALEREGAPEELDLRVQSWRTEGLVRSWTEVAPYESIHVPASGDLPEEFACWNPLRVWELSRPSLDVESGLYFVGDRVISQSGMGFRQARDSAFLSGAFLRIVTEDVEFRDFPVAPLGNSSNYYHFLLESLPRVLAIAAVDPQVVFTTSDIPPSFVSQILDALAVKRQSDPQGMVISSDKMFLCDPSPRFWQHPADVHRVSETLKTSFAVGSTQGSRKVCLSRRQAPARTMTNQIDLELFLVDQGYEIHQMETLSVEEQIQLMSETTVLVGMHGAGLANMIFMNPGSTVVELSTGDHFELCFRRLAASCGHAYQFLRLESSEDAPFGSGQNAVKAWRLNIDD